MENTDEKIKLCCTLLHSSQFEQKMKKMITVFSHGQFIFCSITKDSKHLTVSITFMYKYTYIYIYLKIETYGKETHFGLNM